MNSVTIQPGQTLADIAAQYFNSMEALSSLAFVNGLGLTQEVEPGTVLILPVFQVAKQKVLTGQKTNLQRVAVVQSGQTLPDIAVQYCGSLSALPIISTLNNLAFTASISPGQVLKLPERTDKKVEQYFRRGGFFPASIGVKEIPEGISYWGIEYDFIVQ